MLASQRRSAIAELVHRDGAVRISELVERLGVSEMTIRRDIDRLSSEGVVERVHGGAVAHEESRRSEEPGFAAKSLLQQAEKQAIAAAAAELVAPGSAIGISAGTTTIELARRVVAVPGLTIVTNSLPAAQLLHEAGGPSRTVILTGGVRTPSDALVGPIAVTALESLHVDLLFLGSHGVDARAGLTTPNLVEADTNRALLRSGLRVCVLADATKWGVVGLGTFARLDDVDIFITDSALSPGARRAVTEHAGQLIVVDPEGDAS